MIVQVNAFGLALVGLLIAAASFIAGFIAGDRAGTNDAERRWTESVARAADARDRAAELRRRP